MPRETAAPATKIGRLLKLRIRYSPSKTQPLCYHLSLTNTIGRFRQDPVGRQRANWGTASSETAKAPREWIRVNRLWLTFHRMEANVRIRPDWLAPAAEYIYVSKSQILHKLTFAGPMNLKTIQSSEAQPLKLRPTDAMGRTESGDDACRRRDAVRLAIQREAFDTATESSSPALQESGTVAVLSMIDFPGGVVFDGNKRPCRYLRCSRCRQKSSRPNFTAPHSRQ